ncbi:MAG: hypothetical protein NTW49_11180 [Bacteroidia bacterium]|nr:hypothetical protein [Bacteroidia bacterium]
MIPKIKLLMLAIIEIFIAEFSDTFGQVTLEHSYYIYHKDFFVINLGNNDYKFELIDSSGFSLYNLDHTPYLLHVVPPIPLWRPPSYYGVSYITKTLFDCDSTNIEYVLMNGFWAGNFYIYRTDGTLLFEKDSVTGTIANFNGSIYQNPIVNTPGGAKLLLQFNRKHMINSADSEYVYSLCGTLPTDTNEISVPHNYVQVFPDPANRMINFIINQPNN